MNETEPKKTISGSAIMARLDKLAASELRLNPRPLLIYKPHPREIIKGAAAKFGFRSGVVLNEKGFGTYVGGFFVEIAPQIPSTDENAKFGWYKKPSGSEAGTPNEMITKLGLPDLSAFLLGYREHRVFGRETPVSIRPIIKTDAGFGPSSEGNAIGMIHKFDGKTTVLKWTFMPKGSFFEIGKGKNRRSIALNLAEEVQVIRYMELGMDALLLSGC